MSNKTIAEFMIDPGNRFCEHICVYPEYSTWITYNFGLIVVFIIYKILIPKKFSKYEFYIDIILMISLLMINTMFYLLHIAIQLPA